MQYEQSLFERLCECGLTIQDVEQIPKDIGGSLLSGKLAVVAVRKGHLCKNCGQPHLWIGFVEPKYLPRGLRLLLTRSTARRTKKT